MSDRLTQLRDLREQVRALKGPLTSVDAINLVPYEACPWSSASYERRLLLRALEGSVDAVIALVERVLPGWSWNVGRFPTIRAQLAEPVVTEFGIGIGRRADETAATPELALLTALLSALIKQETP